MSAERPKRRWLRRLGVAALVLLGAAAILIRQNRFTEPEWQVIEDRYRLFEAALERTRPDDRLLAEACDDLAARERLFLAGKFPTTLEAIGRAWARLEGRPWTEELAYFWSLQVDVAPRLVTGPGATAVARVELVADLADEPPPSPEHRLRVRRVTDGAEVLATSLTGGIEEWHARLPDDLAPGTHELEVEVRTGGRSIGAHRFRFDVIPDLEERIGTLRARMTAFGRGTSGRGVWRFIQAQRSAEVVFELLRDEAAGVRSDWSGDLTALLERVELEVAGFDLDRDDRPYPYETSTGDHLRVFAGGDPHLDADDGMICRVLVPPDVPEGETRPLVLALHGFADDEQKWFEFYGGGVLPRLARERGFVLVAPRLDSLAPRPERICALVRRLAEEFPIDEDRVFVIAHSYGARHALEAAATCPDRFAGLALLASAASPRAVDALPAMPIYLACGSRDGRVLSLCRTLAARSAEQGREPLRYREAEGVGHVEIIWRTVEEALDWLGENAR